MTTEISDVRVNARYAPQRILGSHDAGRFISAIDTVEGGRVTIFQPSIESPPATFVESLGDELARCAPLCDSLYCTVRDAGVGDDGRAFVVVRRPAGVSLQHLLRGDGRFGEDRALGIAVQVCDHVRRAQAVEIVPAAIDPGSVFIDDGGESARPGGPRVAIVDLGFHRGVYGAAVPRPQLHELLCSPQILAGNAPHARDDVFSITALVHLMVFGVAPSMMGPHGPADGSGWPALPDDGRLHRRVEPCLHTVLLRGLAPDRAERFPHVAALQRALTGMRQLMNLSTAAFELLAATRGRLGQRAGDPLGLIGGGGGAESRAATARARIREVVAMGGRGAASLGAMGD